MGTAVLLGSRCEPEVELSFGIDDRHPATGELLPVWVKGLPGRRWDARGKLWRVPVVGLPAGTLTAAGFEVTTLAGHPVSRWVVAPVSGRYQDGAGKVPDWFGLELDDYQKLGAEKIAGGGKALCDAMGLGKTRQLLAAAAILSRTRTLILCPPVVLTHWERETGQSGLVEHAVEAPGDLAPPSTQTNAHGDKISLHETTSNSSPARLVVVHPRRKVPDLPDTGVVIVPDTLVAARRQLLVELCAWAPQVLVYDEAHRAKTWESARSLAARSLAGAPGGVVLVATEHPCSPDPTSSSHCST